MNDLNQWERQLRSWTPRRPSARLKERLFAGNEATMALPLSIHSSLFWLTPATCALALCLSFWMMRHESAGSAAYSGSNMLATISLPHPSLAVLFNGLAVVHEDHAGSPMTNHAGTDHVEVLRPKIETEATEAAYKSAAAEPQKNTWSVVANPAWTKVALTGTSNRVFPLRGTNIHKL